MFQSELAKGEILNNQFEVVQLISQGSFGKVYVGKSLQTKQKVAIKVEKLEMSNYLSLEREVEILTLLEGVQQIPTLLWHGKINGQSIIVLNMLGKDLVHFLKRTNGFTFQCVCNIANQMIGILEQIHKRGIIHRDLKPENIVGSPKSDKIYLIDFGIAKNFEVQKKLKEKLPFIGTTRYASLAAHNGIEQSKKDDLESLGYVLIYLIKQKLPWSNIDKHHEQFRVEIIGKLKQSTSVEELCQDLPTQLLRYMRYVRGVLPRQKPNYAMLRGLFIIKYEIQTDMPFDWSRNKIKAQLSHQPNRKRNQANFKSLYQIHKTSAFPITLKHRQSKTITPVISQQRLDEEEDEEGVESSSNQFSVVETHGSRPSVLAQFSFTHSHLIIEKKHEHNLLHIQNYKIARVSTLDAPIIDFDDIMSLQAQQQLIEYENQDLEIKFNLLHFRSVYFNYKNPIISFKMKSLKNY